MKIKSYFNRLEKKMKFWDIFLPEFIITIIFRELSFTLLPLLIIVGVKLLTNDFNYLSFLSSSNLSFAIVILYAINISSFIELKTKLQRDISFRLFEGTKQLIIMLIIASIFLSFTIIKESSVDALSINNKSLAIANIILFLFSIAFTSSKVYYEQLIEYRRKYVELNEYKNQFYFQLGQNLYDSSENLTRFIYFLKNYDSSLLKKNNSLTHIRGTDIFREIRVEKFEEELDRLEKLLIQSKKILNEQKEELLK